MTPAADFDSFIDSYEQALASGAAELADFLPVRGHEQYSAVLRELVRVDLEHSWGRGQRQLVRSYLQRYPELAADREALAEVAFEEFRLRRQAGEAVRAEDYRRELGVDIDAWPSLPSPLPEVGERFLGFQLIAELGRGAFGRVYLAQQNDLAQRCVALKVCAGGAVESQLLAQLQHPNIVPIHSTHAAGSLHAVCMPYVGAATLADCAVYLRSGGTLPATGRFLLEVIAERKRRLNLPGDAEPHATLEALARRSHVDAVLALIADVADGLAHAHERGIIHRDLKPANILLTDAGRPMLVDFNLSADAKQPAPTYCGGTLQYMSPEQLQALGSPTRVDSRSDLYALGVMLFELLTGHSPTPVRQGALHEILPRMVVDRLGPPPDPRQWNRAISPAIRSITCKLLHPKPEQRYQTARELAADLRRQLASLPLQHALDAAPGERIGKFVRRHPRLRSPLTILTMLLLTAGALLAWSLRSNLHEAEKQKSGMQATLTKEQQVRQKAQESLHRAGLEQTARRQAQDKLRKHAEDMTTIRRQFDDAFLQRHGHDTAICFAALDRYRVLDDRHWQDRDDVRLLPGESADQLRHDIIELLYLLNWGTLLEASLAEALQPLLALNAGCAPIVGGCMALRRAKLDQAVSRSELALTLSQSAPPRWLLLQRAALERGCGRLDKAHDCQTAAEWRLPSSPRNHYLTGCECIARAQFGDALHWLKPACDRDPTNAYAWYLLGICHAQLDQHTEAVKCFDASLVLKPNRPQVSFQAGVSNLLVGNWKRASEEFATAMSQQPDLADSFLGILRDHADVVAAATESKHAVLLFNQALRLQPASVPLRLHRGLLAARAGWREVAIQDGAECLARDASPATRYHVACIYARTGDADQAFALLSQALQAGHGAAGLNRDERLEPLRGDPRFAQLCMQFHVATR